MLSQEEILFAKTQGYLKGVHVIVGLPDCLVELAKEPNAMDVLSHLRALAVDEVDACFQVSVQPVCCKRLGRKHHDMSPADVRPWLDAA